MINFRSIEALQLALAQKSISLPEIVQHYLTQIEAKNAELNVFLEVYAQEALAEAARIQAKIEAGTQGKLAGAVIGLKDVLCHQGHGLQAGSKMLDKFIAQFSGTAVERLLAEDAIVIGRQSCDEFAMGSTNENYWFGPTKNADDPSRVPGGSSGASAVAVQAEMCVASIGSDTGGSVRQPAAFCGVTGVKGTYGRISRYGLIAYASSFDCIGSIANSVYDATLLYNVMAGPDANDTTCSQKDFKPVDLNVAEEKTYKIAYLKESFNDSIAPEVRAAFQTKLDTLKATGHILEEVSFPFMDFILPTYYILTTAEASSNLSRYDGIRYGHRSKLAADLEQVYKFSRSEGFGPEVKSRIMLGTFVLSASYYDAYFTKAQKVRRLIKEGVDALLNKFDFILCPTAPTTAYAIGEKTQDPIAMYLGDIFTVGANVCGIPACSIPMGRDSDGLSIGLQIMSAAFEEEKMLVFAHSLEHKLI